MRRITRREQTPRAAQQNIATVAELEREFLRARTLADRVSDAIADFVGSMTFVIFHLVWFSLWVVLNLGVIPSIRAFDPFPFILLSLIVSCEAVLLSTFVLMKQNRMSRVVDQRDHLNLQIDLLAEQEITKILQMQRLICDHLGVKQASEDPEARELSQQTAVRKLAEDLRATLSTDES